MPFASSNFVHLIINQSINQSIHRSIDRSINQSVSHLIIQRIYGSYQVFGWSSDALSYGLSVRPCVRPTVSQSVSQCASPPVSLSIRPFFRAIVLRQSVSPSGRLYLGPPVCLFIRPSFSQLEAKVEQVLIQARVSKRKNYCVRKRNLSIAHLVF